MIRSLLLLCLLAPAAASALPPLPEGDAEVAWALVRAEWLPALEARQATAEEQARARRAYFAGEAKLGEAFPRLAPTALTDPAVLAGRLRALDERMRARIAERATGLDGLDPTRRIRVRAALDAALDAEDAADSLERRLLLSRQDFVEAHPTWTSEGAALRAPLERRLASLHPLVASEEEGTRAAAALEARALDDELVAIRTWARALADRHATRAGELPPLAAEHLEEPWGEVVLERVLAIHATLPAAAPEAEALERRWIENVGLPAARDALPEPPDDLARALTRAETELAARTAALEALPPGEPGSLSALRVELAQARLDRANRWLELLQHTRTSEAGTEAERAREEAERAREEADVAREQADDAAAIAAAEARASAALAQERAAQAWEQARAIESELVEARRDRLQRYTALNAKVERVLRPVLGEAVPDADATYAELRTLVAELRADATTAGQRAHTATQELTETAAVHAAERRQIELAARLDPPLADRWEGALDDESRAWQAAVYTAEESRDITMRLLGETKELRRTLSGYVSSEELARDRADLFADVGSELKLAGPNLISLTRERFGALLSLPGRLDDFGFLSGLVRSSFLTLLLTAMWWFARGRTDSVVGSLLIRIRKQFPSVRPAELRGLREPLLHLGTYSIDLVAGWLLREPLAAIAPELGLLVYVWLQVALFRWGLALFDVLVIRHPERRPAWLVLGPETHALARRTLRLALSWWIARRLAIDLALGVLGADALAEAVGMLFSALGLALLVWALHMWHQPLLARVGRLHQGSAVVRFLARQPPWTLRVPHSLAMLLYLSAALGWDLLDRLARRQEGVGRLFNAMNLYRLGQREESAKELLPLPAEVLDTLRQGTQAVIRRTAVEAQILECAAAWKEEHRRGLVALVGDRGDGKGVLLDQLEGQLAVDGRAAQRITLTARIRTEKQALAWLGELLGLKQAPDTADAAVEALSTREPTAFVIEDLHLAFLRTVGGFEGLNALLYVFNASCDRHLWLVTLHGPAWRYLTHISMVDTGIFRRVIPIPPLGEDELRELTQRRLSIAGYTADFSPLVRTNPFGTDPEVELERTTSAFYRLLLEASSGNPAVALHLFADCLSADPEREGVALVTVRKSLSRNVDSLPDPELFALTAIRTHARLALDELVEVTNMGLVQLRQIVKNLQSQGLLEATEQICIPGVELPAVTRTLRRRHFLYGEG